MEKDRDYAHYLGDLYLDEDGSFNGFTIKTFLDMCIEKRRLVAAYKTLSRVKADYRRTFNTEYDKHMGYAYMFNLKPYTITNHDSLNIKGISHYEYCLARINEDYLNHKLHSISEELSFLNMNIKVMRPLFREYKRRCGKKKISLNDDIKNTYNLHYGGLIDVNTDVSLLNLSEDEVEGIKKFLEALDNARCSYMSYKLDVEKREK